MQKMRAIFRPRPIGRPRAPFGLDLARWMAEIGKIAIRGSRCSVVAFS
jgi:hypothetical protein